MLCNMSENPSKPPSFPFTPRPSDDQRESDQEISDGIALPSHADGLASLAGSGTLDQLVDTARDYAEHATAENTNRAYKKDWAHFSSWCRRLCANAQPPDPQLIGLYIAECAAPQDNSPTLSVSTIERHLSGLS